MTDGDDDVLFMDCGDLIWTRKGGRVMDETPGWIDRRGASSGLPTWSSPTILPLSDLDGF